MNKLSIFSLTLASLICGYSIKAEAQCATQPSCSSLGYTRYSTSGCIGTALKCPFDNMYSCITQSDLSNYSKNSSNWWYQDKATGLIFQGGKVNVTSASSGKTVYFNKYFSTAPMTLVLTPYNAPSNAPNDINQLAFASNVSSSSFVLNYSDSDTSNRRTGYVSWFAVGY